MMRPKPAQVVHECHFVGVVPCMRFLSVRPVLGTVSSQSDGDNGPASRGRVRPIFECMGCISPSIPNQENLRVHGLNLSLSYQEHQVHGYL